VFLFVVGDAVDVMLPGVSKARINDALFFRLGWSHCGFHKKRPGSCYAKLLFLHPVGSAGYVVHSSASVAGNVDALFFMLRWALSVSIQSAPGHVTWNMCFCIRWDLWVM
jgi:hypothetical protein